MTDPYYSDDQVRLNLDGLACTPPPAAIRGDQRLWWCAHCGSVLITTTARRPDGPCPACDRQIWRQARLPICGLHRHQETAS